MVSVDFVLAKGVENNQPFFRFTINNPTTPANERIYAFILAKDFEGDFDVVFNFNFEQGGGFTSVHHIPPASWQFYNAWAFLNAPLPPGNHSVDIDAGPLGAITLPFNVAGITPVPEPEPEPEVKDAVDFLKESISLFTQRKFSEAWDTFLDSLKAPKRDDPEFNKLFVDIGLMALPVSIGKTAVISKIAIRTLAKRWGVTEAMIDDLILGSSPGEVAEKFRQPINKVISIFGELQELIKVGIRQLATGNTALEKLIREKGFFPAVDDLLSNPINFVKDWGKISEGLRAQIIVNAKAKAGIEPSLKILNTAFEQELISRAPLLKRTLFALEKHKGKGLLGLITLAGSLMGFDLWGNWDIVDSVATLTKFAIKDIDKALKEGEITKEEALKLAKRHQIIITAGDKKVKSSTFWNLIQIAFAPLWDDKVTLIREDTDKFIKDLEELEGPVETTEEKFERIADERRKRQEEEALEDQILWDERIALAEQRKAEAKLEDQVRWDEILLEQERRREERRQQDQLFWDERKAEQERLEEEKKIADASFWDRVNEEKRNRKLLEREEDQLFWDQVFTEQESRKSRKEPGLTFGETTRSPDFPLLAPPFSQITGFEEIAPGPEKELLINIETTDVLPWKGRIFSIALLDLSSPENEPVIFVEDDEKKLLESFIITFNSLDFKKLVGFKVIFDYRYIFNKLMLYRLQSKKWAEIELRDVKQLMDQVKEEFVYFPSKKGKLDDYAKELLGRGKLAPQETLLREYLRGNFSFVADFQMRQIEITRDLYSLHRFSSSEGSPKPQSSHLEEQSGHKPEEILTTVISTNEKTCKKCLQLNPLNLNKCLVCGDPI